MKRALAMALGAMMVAGSAAPASAASQIDFSGYYRLYAHSGTNMGHFTDDRGFTDAFFLNRLVFDITFRPTDELEIVTQLRLPTARRWGSGNSGNNTGSGFRTHHYYANIKQDWGTISVGRFSQGMHQYGLGSLGYAPGYQPVYTYASPFDSGSNVEDGIRYKNKWDNGFGIMAQYTVRGNNSNGEGQGSTGIGEEFGSDQDKERFQVEGTYEWDGGGVALNVRYDRDASANKRLAGTTYRDIRTPLYDGGWFVNADPDANPAILADGAIAGRYANGISNLVDNRNSFYINPAVMHSWGDFSFHFEAMAGWGETNFANKAADQRDLDEEGYAAYLDLDYNYGPGNVTLSAWWNAGTDVDEGYGGANNRLWDPTRYGKSKSLVSVNQGNFNPLLVALNNTWLPNAYRTGIADGGERTGDFAASGIGMANNAYANYVFQNYAGGSGGTARLVSANWTGTGGGTQTAENILNAGNASIGTGSGFTFDRNGVSLDRRLSFNNGTEANHWAIMLGGNHAFTDDITMHYGIAYLALNEPNYRIANSATGTFATNGNIGWGNYGYQEQDKDLGFEIDLGFSFQLLDNLKLTTSFGYMFNGDAYKNFRGYNVTHSGTATAGGVTTADRYDVQGVWEDADDSYVWQSTLTFSF